MPMLRFLQTFCEIEIQQTDGINRTEMEVPVTSTLSLLTDREGGVIQSTPRCCTTLKFSDLRIKKTRRVDMNP